MTTILASLATNPVFLGLFGATLVGMIIWFCREIPRWIWRQMVRQFTVTIEIENSEEIFEKALAYLSKLEYATKARWTKMIQLYDERERRWTWRVSIGSGWHFLRDAGTLFWVHRNLERDKNLLAAIDKPENLTIRCMGRSQAPLKALMKRIEDDGRSPDLVRVYEWNGSGYTQSDVKRARPLDTIFIPQEQKDRIMGNLRAFMAGEEEHFQRGTPWRRGVLLEGPPGTGKTSLAFAIAGALGLDICLINLNTVGGDMGLAKAFRIPDTTDMILIEDIDSAKVTHQRGESDVQDVSLDPSKNVTLSGLLNVLDGLAGREGRVTVITTNHADKLDKALVRPGRIDVREVIGNIQPLEAMLMAMRLRPDLRAPEALATIGWGVDVKWSPARLQSELLALEKAA